MNNANKTGQEYPRPEYPRPEYERGCPGLEPQVDNSITGILGSCHSKVNRLTSLMADFEKRISSVLSCGPCDPLRPSESAPHSVQLANSLSDLEITLDHLLSVVVDWNKRLGL